MKRFDTRLVIGGLLILAGFVFLLESLGLFAFAGVLSGFLAAGLFALGGLAFLFVLINDRSQWWAAIPGFVLLGLSATILSDQIGFLRPLSGGIFLGSIGLGFVTVYILKPENWWAIIPAGVLGTLGVVAVSEEALGFEGGGLFFLGLAATFGVLALVNTPEGRMRWPLFPAAALLVLAVVVGTPFENFLNLLWPLAIIGVGIFLIFRHLTEK